MVRPETSLQRRRLHVLGIIFRCGIPPHRKMSSGEELPEEQGFKVPVAQFIESVEEFLAGSLVSESGSPSRNTW